MFAITAAYLEVQNGWMLSQPLGPVFQDPYRLHGCWLMMYRMELCSTNHVHC